MKLCLLLTLSIFHAPLVTSEEKSLHRPKAASRFENNAGVVPNSNNAGVVPNSSSEDVNALLREVKRELKAEFQAEMNELKSQFKEELQRQREELTRGFENLLQDQHEKLIRQCQHASKFADQRQDSITETQASASDADVSRHSRSDDLGPLETVVAQATQRLDQMDADIRALQSRNAELQNGVDAESQARGTTYTRWGSASCHNLSELVYSGILGGGIASDNTAPANYLCLTMDPTYGTVTLPSVVNANAVYGCEYELYGGVTENTAPACAVCRVPRSTSIMIPGTNRCNPGWNLEYTGHLMAGQRGEGTFASTEYICVDAKHDYIPGTQHNDGQCVVHWVVTACGELPCPPYQNQKITTCVVCSK